jgi:hypothetical protein
MSLGGYLSMFEKHEGKSAMTVGDCRWSVAGRNGKRVRTQGEASRSEEVVKQIQKDQKERSRVMTKSPVLKNRFEVMSTHEEHDPSIEEDGRKQFVPPGLNKSCGDLHCISKGMLAPMRSDVSVKTVGGRTYKKVSGLVDSGAVDSVTNDKIAPWIPIQQTAASRSRLRYTVADGRTVLNKGQQNFSGTTEDGLPIDMGIQITDVCKTLFSVRKIKEAGNIVIFGADEGDMIINRRSGSRTMIEDNGKDYQLSIWMEVPKEATKRVEALSSVEAVIREELKTKSIEEIREGHETMWDRLLSSGEATFQRQDI